MVATPVTVAVFDNVFEAGYWQGLLEAQGIPVVLIDREIVAAEWQIARAVGSIKMQVPDAEAERAREILKTLRQAARDQPTTQAEAPRALRAAFLGLLFPPLQIYSLWLLARLFPRRRDLGGDDRRRLRLAALLCLWLPVVVIVYCSLDWSR